MPDVVERLKRDFHDPDYRHVYDEGFLNSSLATQIKVLREERQWTQAQLAAEAKMNQSRISELEDINFNSWTIRTLRKLARAFDLRLKISFEEFGTLLDDFRNLNRGALSRHSFPDDYAFSEPAVQEPEPEEELVTAKHETSIVEMMQQLVQRGVGNDFGDAFPPAFSPAFAEPFPSFTTKKLAQIMGATTEEEEQVLFTGVRAAQRGAQVILIDRIGQRQRPDKSNQESIPQPVGDAA